MFGILKKKKIKEDSVSVETALVPSVSEEKEEAETQTAVTLFSAPVIAQDSVNALKEKEELTEEKEKDDDFSAFAALLGESAEDVKDEFRLHEIKRFAQKLGKITVRYELKDSEAAKIVNNCSNLAVSEILASPAYLDAYRKTVVKGGLYGQKICAFIDFPFGESMFKSKIADIKACLKYGVDGFTVVMPAISVKDTGAFKSQIKKLGKIAGKPTGVAFSAQELDAEKIKLIIKTAEKTDISSLTFIFGDATEEEIKTKAATIRKNRGKKEIRILGNVSTEKAAAALCALGADKVMTPFADDIAKDLVKRFNVKRVKLL